MRKLVGVALICGCVFQSPRAAAEAPASLALRAEAHRAKTWRYAWTSVNTGLMALAFVAVPLVQREDRPDWIVSGIGSGITVLTTWFWPLRVESAAVELDALGPRERDQQLPRLLRESADDEHARVRWPWHLANVGFAAAGGAVIAFGYHHYASGALTAAAGAAIGEVQILTQPTGLAATGGAARASGPWLTVSPGLGARPGSWGLSLSGAF